MDAKKFTFLKLIKEFSKIEIPIIQRSYAQGRNNSKEQEIRKTFIETIKKVLSNDEKLCLDFVYGTVENGTFIPIDGQQRLTTLFLLYWYFLIYKSTENKESKKLLSKFTYETRESSKEFCRDLVNEELTENEEKISEKIRNQTWFYLEWEHDPTINAMLNMLQTIEDTFKECDKIIIQNRLKGNTIYFYFIETQEFGTAEDLYIKMNSRGKPVTDFEKFKAKLEEEMKEIEGISQKELEDFRINIDNKWINCFIKYIEKEEDKITIDDVSKIDKWIMNLLVTIMENNYILRNYENNKENTENNIKKMEQFICKNEEISISELLELGNFKNIETIRGIECILNYLSDIDLKTESNNDAYKDIVVKGNLIKKIININDSQKVERCYKVQFYALYKYLYLNNKNTIDNKEISKILYVVRNLTENFYIDDETKYYKILHLVDQLISEKQMSIFHSLAKTIIEDIDAQEIQSLYEVERKKTQLILEDKEWEKEILEADRIPYFSGNTGFLLEFASDDTELEQPVEYSKYQKYRNLISIIFGKNENTADIIEENEVNDQKEEAIISDDKLDFRRALFCYGNYMYPIGRRYSLLKCDGDKYQTWKKLLSYTEKEQRREQRKYVKYLLDDIMKQVSQYNQKNIEKVLQEIIQEKSKQIIYKENDELMERCRKKYIEYPEIMKTILEKENKNLGYLCMNNNTLFITRRTTTGSLNFEFFTYALKIALQKKYPDERERFVCEWRIGRNVKEKVIEYANTDIKMQYNFEAEKYQIFRGEELFFETEIEKELIEKFNEVKG